MITDEQIQKLKPGDPLILHGTFDSIYEDGDICIYVKARGAFSDEVLTESIYAHPSCVSMPPEKPIEIFHTTKIPEVYPKYDPCRKFRKGDMVRYCAPDGRIYADRGSLREHIKNRDLTHVVRDEQENGRVGVYDPLDEENPYYVPAHSLELVTPVEELEPYYIIDDDCNEEHPFYVIQNRNSKLSSGLDEEIMRFVYGQDYTADKETVRKRAEAECARLNAEYRKEREND